MSDETGKKMAEPKVEIHMGKETAKKDWVLHQNKWHFEIKAGKPLPEGIPKHLIEALKTEKVI